MAEMAEMIQVNWIFLPIELRLMILSIHHDRQYEAAAKIQKLWRKYEAPKEIAMMLANSTRINIDIDYSSYPDAMDNKTADIIEYCSRVIKGGENPVFWVDFLRAVDKALWIDVYTGGPNVDNYMRIEYAAFILSNRYNREPLYNSVY